MMLEEMKGTCILKNLVKKYCDERWLKEVKNDVRRNEGYVHIEKFRRHHRQLLLIKGVEGTISRCSPK